MEKRHIIFDFANVLVVYDPKEYIKRLFESEGERLAAYNALFNSLQWLKLDRGVISEQEALQAILGNTPDPLKEKVEYLFYNWHKNIKPIPEMELLVKQLKERGYKLYLLSNIAKSYELYRESIPALKYMDYEFLHTKSIFKARQQDIHGISEGIPLEPVRVLLYRRFHIQCRDSPVIGHCLISV